MTLKDLLDSVYGAGTAANININVTFDGAPVDTVLAAPESIVPVTDFTVGDRVLINHTRRDGTLVEVSGTVDTDYAEDSYGSYTRVTGDNGKHYKAGVHVGEARKGTTIVRVL